MTMKKDIIESGDMAFCGSYDRHTHIQCGQQVFISPPKSHRQKFTRLVLPEVL